MLEFNWSEGVDYLSSTAVLSIVVPAARLVLMHLLSFGIIITYTGTCMAHVL